MDRMGMTGQYQIVFARCNHLAELPAVIAVQQGDAFSVTRNICESAVQYDADR